MAVVTGQQPVLFTGPLFSIFKAISAIKIATTLEQAGINAVPVFWVAAEDHDFEEISSTWVLNRNSELSRMGVDLASGEPVPAGWLEFKEDVRTAVSECLSNLPQSEFIPELQTILESSYKPGVSPVAGIRADDGAAVSRYGIDVRGSVKRTTEGACPAHYRTGDLVGMPRCVPQSWRATRPCPLPVITHK